MTRWWGRIVSVAVVASVLSPLVRELADDGFPLSTYPMFAHRRSSWAEIDHIVAYSVVGRHRAVPPRLVANDEVMQAAAMVTRSIRRKSAASLCHTVAARVAADPRFEDVLALEVRRDGYDAVEYFSGERAPQSTRVFARCEIPGRR